MPQAAGQVDPLVGNLLEASRFRTQSIELLFGAYRDNRLITAGLAVQSPGSAALIFVSNETGDRDTRRAMTDVLMRIRDAAWESGTTLLEVLVACEDQELAHALGCAGFRRLTRLLYLRRACDIAPASDEADWLTWVSFAEDRQALFEEAILRTYAQSLDCPELKGTRSIADVVAGHRATGDFDPSLWWVAMRDDAPVGVCLLSVVTGRRALEIVYMGVAHSARGTGVGDALLARTLVTAQERGVNEVALAVDERNSPARKLYARWSFVDVDSRDAWTASSVASEG